VRLSRGILCQKPGGKKERGDWNRRKAELACGNENNIVNGLTEKGMIVVVMSPAIGSGERNSGSGGRQYFLRGVGMGE